VALSQLSYGPTGFRGIYAAAGSRCQEITGPLAQTLARKSSGS